MTKKTRETSGGRFYERQPDELTEVPAGGRTPDVVICRRVVDYPFGQPLPPGADLDTCHRCSALIVYDTRGPFPDVPRICLQCAGIQPLPFPD
jgi:hypothetical protein